jgi:hypothetical protein
VEKRKARLAGCRVCDGPTWELNGDGANGNQEEGNGDGGRWNGERGSGNGERGTGVRQETSPGEMAGGVGIQTGRCARAQGPGAGPGPRPSRNLKEIGGGCGGRSCRQGQRRWIRFFVILDDG